MNPITLPLAELKPALTGLGKIIGKRHTLPVLGMIKVERTKDGWIALTSTDLDSFATVRMEQPAEGEAVSLLVPFEELQKVAKSCGKSDSILIRSGEKASELSVILETTVGGQPIQNRCTSLPVDEFPATPKFQGDAVALPDAVRHSIHEAIECASEDEKRLILNGAFIDVSERKCHCIVGTNGNHLYSSNSFALPISESVVIPTHAFLGFKEFNADGEWQMKTLTDAKNKDLKHVQLATRRWRFITKQHIGIYPNWRQVVPDKFNTSIHFEDADSLIQTIQRLPEHDKVNHTIGLALENGGLALLARAKADDPWLNVAVKATATGKDVKVFVNREYLIKALRFGMTRMDVMDEKSAVRFSDEKRQMIVMPLRPDSIAASEPKPAEQPAAQNAAQTERKQPVINGENQAPPSEETLEQCIEDLEKLKESMQANVGSLTTLKSKLKNIQREQKSSAKELQSVRQTIKGLQSVKL